LYATAIWLMVLVWAWLHSRFLEVSWQQQTRRHLSFNHRTWKQSKYTFLIALLILNCLMTNLTLEPKNVESLSPYRVKVFSALLLISEKLAIINFVLFKILIKN